MSLPPDDHRSDPADPTAGDDADRPVPSRATDADEPVLPTRSADDRDVGWGDEPRADGGRDEQWYRDQRPPHWE